jgi:chemotaxis signal transduction protein
VRRTRQNSKVAVARDEVVLAARADVLARRGAESGASIASQPMLICDLGGSLYGLPLRDIERVEVLERLAAAPAADRAFIGLVGAAARIRPAFDLATLLGLAAPSSAMGYILICRGEAGVALRIAERPLIADVSADGHEPTRGLVASGEIAGRVVTLVSAPDLLAPFFSSSAVGALK